MNGGCMNGRMHERWSTNALMRECTKRQREACVRIIAFLHSCILTFSVGYRPFEPLN
jgi:hypothetical protein